MSPGSHEELRRDLGVYVLGALDPAERDRFERHLSTCDDCRQELAGLAVLPALLTRLGEEDHVAGAAPAPLALPSLVPPPLVPPRLAPPPLERVLEAVARRRRRERRRNRLLALAATLAVCVAAVTVAALVVPRSEGSARLYVADASSVTARIEERPWGMAVRISAQDLPPRAGYAAFAVADDGHRAHVASWSDTGVPVELEGSCYLRVDEVAQVEIVGAPGDEVLSVLRPG